MKYRSFSAGATLLLLYLGCYTPKRETTGCTIAGASVAEGTPNPASQCQVCKARSNPADWSNLPPGTACGKPAQAVCLNGACTAGCQISGVFYGPGDPSPSNACQTCQPRISVSSFSPATGLAPGGTCGSGSYCYQGQCSGGCSIAGSNYRPGDPDPGNPCRGCVPAVSTTAWSSFDPGTRCAGGVCVGGACLLGCNISNVLVASGALDPSDVCHSCQPDVNPTAWSPVTGIPSSGCLSGQVCLDGGCVAGCFIASSFHAPGEFRDNGGLRIDASCCGPSHDLAAWSPVFTAGPITRNPNFDVPFTPTRFGNPPPLVADFNRDGRPDLAVLRIDAFGLTTSIAVYLGSSDGGFDQSSPDALDSTSLAVADLNRDGYPDLVASDADGGVTVLLSLRDGTFGPPTGYASNLFFYDGGLPISYSSRWNGQQPNLTVVDVDGDGLPDVLVAGGSFGGLSLLSGVGNGTLKSGVAITSGTTSTYAIQVADLNGDGLPDLFIQGDTTVTYLSSDPPSFQTSDPAFLLMLNDGRGGFGAPLSGPLAAAFSNGPTIHDFNGDLRADLAFPRLTDPPLILFGVGDGGFTATDANPGGAPMVVSDLNGDGLPDLVLGGTSVATQIFLNLGDGKFSYGIATSSPPDLWSGTATDLNGDGLDDLAVEDSDGNLSIWFEQLPVSQRACQWTGSGDFDTPGPGSLRGGTMRSRLCATFAASLLLLPGLGCSGPKGEVTGCSIDGNSIPDGTRNPQNECQACKAQASLGSWSNLPSDTACGQGSGAFCAGGSCQAGCYIQAIFYLPGVPDPANPCSSCQPSVNATGWSPISGPTPPGACPMNGVCYLGHCQPGCTIGTTPVPAGAPNPDNFCQSCQPGQGTSTWTNKLPGAPCADGGAVCANGNCTAGCEIDGVFYSPGGPSPDNVCQTCQPKLSVFSFSPATGLAPGGDCGSGAYCFKGQCSGGCAIAGTSYAPGDADPSNACLGCNPTISVTTWSQVDPGSPCAGGGVCSGGTCLFGCQIGGVLYPPGTDDPSEVCQSCQPAVTPSGWSPLTGIPTDGCTGGEVCLDGGCTTGCFIKRTYYPEGQRKPGDTAQCCSPLSDPGVWSPAFVAGPSLIPSFSTGYYSTYLSQIQVADFNLDNLSDVVVLGTNPAALSVFMNQGDGGFSETYTASNLSAFSVGAGDINADGYPDLVAGAPDKIYVLTNRGDGGFSGAVSHATNVTYYDAGPLPDGGGGYYYYSSYYPYYFNGPSVALADINRDGTMDVVAAGGVFSGNASVFLGTGNGGLAAGVPFNTGLVSTYLVTSADFNGDSWPDLVMLGDTNLSSYVYDYGYGTYGYVYSANPSIYVYLNDGTGAFTQQTSGLPGYVGSPTAFAVGDFDGDGTPDLAVTSSYNAKLQIFRGLGNGTFAQPVSYAVPYVYNSEAVTVGDFDGDGTQDLVVSGYSFALFLNKGDGTFLPGAPIVTLTYPYAGAAGRFFGKSPDDLATIDYNLTFTPYFNNCR